MCLTVARHVASAAASNFFSSVTDQIAPIASWRESTKLKDGTTTSSLSALTGLRFIAAACIVIAHLTATGAAPFGFHFNFAPAGMPLFFTLSGFIIHYAYHRTFDQSWRRSTREFAVARVSRLYPLFGCLFVYSLLFTSLGKALDGKPLILLSYATMTASWWYWQVDGVSLPELQFGWSWSVSTEVFFYGAYLAGLYRIWAIRRLERAVAALVVFCLFSYVLVFLVIDTRDAWAPLVQAALPEAIPATTAEPFSNSFLRWLIYVSPYLHLLEFIAGILTCQIYLLMQRQRTTIGTSHREALAWGGVAWVAVGVIYDAAIPSIIGHLPSSSIRYLVDLNFMNMNFLLAPGCCAIILAVSLGGSSLQRVLALSSMVGLGELSYSLYLAHPFISKIAYVSKETEHPLLGYIVVGAVLLIVSDALYRRLEVPAKMFLRRLLGGRESHVAQAVWREGER